jgi:hypothetical protein
MKGRHLPIRFWIEAAMASITGVLAILTLIWKDWIEIVFGVDPDHHNGSFEWLIVAVCLAATVVFSLLASRAWKMAIEATTL